MISNGIILGRNVYAKWVFFFCDLFTEDDDKVDTFGLWFLVLVGFYWFFGFFVLFNIF